METNVRYTIVGLFVMSIFAFVILSIIWLSAGLSAQTYKTYKVYMKESVSGLTIDSAVEYNGVNVGTVRGIAISRRDPEVVDVLLSVRSNTPITVDTTATMNMRGLTGVTFIALQDKGTNKILLKRAPGEDYPVIRTRPSLLTRFDQALNQLNDSVHTVSISIQQLLSEKNMGLIHSILSNLNAATVHFAPLVETSLQTLQSFGSETLPAANQTMYTIDRIMNNLTVITNELKNNPSILIRGKEPPPLGPGENK